MAKIKKVGPEDAVVLGIDPSLNGTAFILMQNEKIIDYKFFTGVKKIYEANEGKAVYNKETDISRLVKIINVFNIYLNGLKKGDFFPNYAGIEDYAYGAKSNSVFQIGGLGEALRVLLYDSGIPYRDVEPSKLKKYATGSGNAEKSQMVLEAYKNGFDTSPFGKSGEDLADAYWLARMISTELKLHKNSNYLNELSKKQQEVFTEVTKAYPIPILNRPFISRRD
jgi:Holliday junction resolvasome RuvABC endonuclease subunit